MGLSQSSQTCAVQCRQRSPDVGGEGFKQTALRRSILTKPRAINCRAAVVFALALSTTAGVALHGPQAAAAVQLQSQNASEVESAYAALEGKYGDRDTWGDIVPEGAAFSRAMFPGTHWVHIGSTLLGSVIKDSSKSDFNRDLFRTGVDLSLMLFGGSSSDPLVDALGEISAQLSEISAQLDQILDLLMQMNEDAAWNAFETQDGFVRLGVTNIQSASNLIYQWASKWDIYEENGQLPTQEDYTYVKQLLYEGVGQLNTHLTSTNGAVKQLSQAVDINVNVSDLTHYWAVVLDYIDYNKSVLARALSSLRWLSDHDESPAFMSYVDATIATVEETIIGMYQISGVPIPQVDGARYIHGKGESVAITYVKAINALHSTNYSEDKYKVLSFDWITGRPTFPGENSGIPKHHGTHINGHMPLQHLVRTYDPARHGGQDFLQFLDSQELPRNFHNSSCWWSVKEKDNGFCNKYSMYDYGKVNLGTGDGGFFEVYNDGQALNFTKYIHGDLNPGGRLASFDPERIEEIAFGIKDFQVVEGANRYTVKLTADPYGVLELIDAETGEVLAVVDPESPDRIDIPAAGDEHRAILVDSQYEIEGKVATYATSAFVIDGSQNTQIDFELNLTGEPEIPEMVLTIKIDDQGSGDGSVSTDKGQFLCGSWAGSTCEVPLYGDKKIALYAHPVEFDSWSGACAGYGVCEIDPKAGDQTVTAHFAAW